MRIAVDVMGGDHGCGVVVSGAKMAMESLPVISELHLVGQRSEIEAALSQTGLSDPRVKIFHASEVLAMDDKPVSGLRKKKDCSLLRAVELVKDGRADAVISPGNTGGMVAASTIRLRPLEGVERPGIATVMPARENEFVLIDAGANVDSKPIHLLHYAIMGSVYSNRILGYEKPRVGLLSVGTEESKGNELVFDTHKLLKGADIHFIGNVEGHDLFSNRVDVVVCDGFVGNIVLKTCENLARSIFSWIKMELTRTPVRKLGAALVRGGFAPMRQRLDADTYGGAPLLGLNGNVMIAHGSASEIAIKNAIRVATETVSNNVNQIFLEKITAENERVESLAARPS